MSNLAAQPDAPSDAELISRVRAGDQAAYGQLFERHREAAHRMARQLVRGPDMDDLISEAFTKVFVQLQRGGGPDVAFRAYLLTSIRRLHVDRTRTNQRVQVTDDLEDLDRGVDFVDPATSDFERGAASRAFTSLPERWQLVLWHLEVEGQKPADIAPLLGMSPNSVAALAYRAREGLRQAYLQSHLADTADEACRWTTERLGAYVRKGLAKRDSAKVEAHLDGCHRCTAVYLELTEVNSNLSGLLAPALLGLAAPGYLAATGTKIGLLLLWPWTKLKDAGAGAQAGAAGAAVAAVVAVAAVAGVFGGGGDDTNEASEPSTQQTAPDQKDSPPDNQQEPKNDDTPPDNQQQDPEPPPDEQPPPDEDAPEADEPPDDAPPPDVVPETPTDVTGDIRGSNVVLRWDPVDDARGYRVYRKSSPAAAATGVTAAGVTAAGLAASAEGPTNAVPATYSVAPSTTVTATVTATTTPVAYPAAGPGAGPVVSDGVIQETSFRDNSLVDGNKYRYVVTAVGSGEESQVSEPVTVTYNPVPSAPTRVRASERNSGIALRWAANSEPDIDEYRILRDGEQVGTTSSPRFKDDSAVDGSTYTYSVVALDRSGQASGESRSVDATYDPAPSAPTGLSVDERGAKLALTWDENTEPDIDEYNVYRDGDKIASIDRPRYIDTDAPDGATTYTVTAVDASGQESTESGDATFDADPRRPRGVDATQVDSGIAVTWNDNAESDIDHYIVLRGGDEIATVTKPRYRDTAVVDGDSYAYRIVAVDDEGNESPRSRPARAAYDPAPDAPTGLTAKVRGNTIKLDWDDSTEPDL
ncbi:MAG: sigma-70 family RNA polymerase sigma factor, partial [Actinomycetia bacterium]|nr:sigma-70 family RNA polymerase sigma factor [Actinomycetes bacterium]